MRVGVKSRKMHFGVALQSLCSVRAKLFLEAGTCRPGSTLTGSATWRYSTGLPPPATTTTNDIAKFHGWSSAHTSQYDVVALAEHIKTREDFVDHPEVAINRRQGFHQYGKQGRRQIHERQKP